MISLLLWLLGIAFVALLIISFITLRVVRSLRFSKGEVRIATGDDVPEFLPRLLQEEFQQLTHMGFVFCGYKYEKPLQSGTHFERPVLVMYQAQTCSFAELSLVDSPQPGLFFAATFATHLSNQKVFISGSGFERDPMLAQHPRYIGYDPKKIELQAAWLAHQRRLDEVEESEASRRVGYTFEQYVAQETQLINEQLVDMVSQKQLLPAGDNSYRLSLSAAIRFTYTVLLSHQIRSSTAQAYLKKLRTSQNAVFAHSDDHVKAYLRSFHRVREQLKKKPLGWLPKLALIVGSMLFFGFSFYSDMSWSSLIILMAVLFIHELGHILGMLVFGYRDLQVLFIPFLGAAAIGKEDDIPNWQRIIVFFLGPIPGIFLGLLLWYLKVYYDWDYPWLTESILWLIFLNAFNLLPIYPMDGGHIFSLSFFSRLPYLNVIFLGMSAALFGLLGLVGGGLLIGIAVTMFISLIGEFHKAGIFQRVRLHIPQQKQAYDEAFLLHHIFDEVEQSILAKKAYSQKHNIVEDLLKRLRQPLPGWGTMAGVVLVYALPLWLLLFAWLPISWMGDQHLRQAQEKRAAQSTSPALSKAPDDAQNVAFQLEALIAELNENKGLRRKVEEVFGFYNQFIYTTDSEERVSLLSSQHAINDPSIQALVRRLSAALKQPYFHRAESFQYNSLYQGFNYSDESFDYLTSDYLKTTVTLFEAQAAIAASEQNWNKLFVNINRLIRLAQVVKTENTLPALGSSTAAFSAIRRSFENATMLGLPAEHPEIMEMMRHLLEEEATLQTNYHQAFKLNSHLLENHIYSTDWSAAQEEQPDELYDSWWFSLFMTEVNPKTMPLYQKLPFYKLDQARFLELQMKIEEHFQAETSPVKLNELLNKNDPSFCYFGTNHSWHEHNQLSSGWAAIQAEIYPTVVAMVLYKYHHVHGAYPESLEKMVPEYIQYIPEDPYSGDPLHYQRIDAGFELGCQSYFDWGLWPDWLNQEEDAEANEEEMLLKQYWLGRDAHNPDPYEDD